MQKKFHHLARGIFIQNNKVLLAKAKGYPNTFLPGGHVEIGESAKEALIREIMEELGIDSQVGSFLGLIEHSWEHQGKLHFEINQVFEVTSLDLNPHANPVSAESHLEFFWCSESEFDESNLEPYPIRNLIKNYLNGERIVGWESTILTSEKENINENRY